MNAMLMSMLRRHCCPVNIEMSPDPATHDGKISSLGKRGSAIHIRACFREFQYFILYFWLQLLELCGLKVALVKTTMQDVTKRFTMLPKNYYLHQCWKMLS